MTEQRIFPVEDLGGVRYEEAGTLALRPLASAVPGGVYYRTDGTEIYYSDGVSWSQKGGGAAPASIDGVSNNGGNIDLIAGAGMTITPDDAANTITLASSGGGSGNPDMLELSPTEVSVTTAVTLDSTAFSKMHVLSGAASYTVTLPPGAGSGGKIIGFRVARGYQFWATLDGSGNETIDGELARSLWELETAYIAWNGTEWTKLFGKPRPMVCAMRNTAPQSLANATVTKISLQQADVNLGRMADTANGVSVIRRSGPYDITAQAYYASGIVPRAISAVYNGVTQLFSQEESAYVSTAFPVAVAVAVQNLVAGDQLELRGYQDSGGARNALGGTTGAACLLIVKESNAW